MVSHIILVTTSTTNEHCLIHTCGPQAREHSHTHTTTRAHVHIGTTSTPRDPQTQTRDTTQADHQCTTTRVHLKYYYKITMVILLCSHLCTRHINMFFFIPWKCPCGKPRAVFRRGAACRLGSASGGLHLSWTARAWQFFWKTQIQYYL